MLTLNAASVEIKQLLKIGAIFLAILVIVFILVKIIILVKDVVFPTPPPKPTTLFGQLPQQTFPQNVTNQNFTYTINTLSGYLPQEPTITNVYKMQANKPDLLAVNKFQDKVTSIGYPGNYSAISDTIVQWQLDSSGLTKILQANIVTNNFTIKSAYATDKTILSGANLPDLTTSLAKASDMLTSMGLLSDDLDQSKTTTNLYSLTNGTLAPATSLSTTQIIEVDYYQKDINNLPIYYEKPNSSNINILIGGGQNSPQIVSATYIHQVPSNELATYPLKSTTQAFDDLKQGKGYIASYDGSSNNISINNVTLAYYISSQSQDFLMPIFVFTGNDNFYAYVPAITDGWISK